MKDSENFDYTSNDLDIAIIGIAGRWPGAKNLEEFWQNLRDGVESISFFSEEELKASGIDTTVLNDPNYVKAKSIIEDIELFDASFFGFAAIEADVMDPQHRFLLECAWEALESAGYDPDQRSIGVYAGSSRSSYFFNFYSNPKVIAIAGDLIGIGNAQDFLTTRVSYRLNLKGPSYTIQTACSTSLVAVHIACQSLLNNECDMALAGGISITLPQKAGYQYQQEGINSPDGHCRAFDARAQGTVFGNGIGLVVLKRLEDALTDGDTIHAVIKGSAINNDGSLKVSYAAPSVDGQADVIIEALSDAGVKPDTVTYVETHGTGTSLGDPIEITALTQAFNISTQKKGFCAIGSVKTNIGHLDAAAGVAGLIKTVLALKHKQIPPSLHFEKPNPKIDFANSPFYVNTTLSEWKTNGTPRRAGVSSFGFGGTNAHVILEEAPVVRPSGPSRPIQLLLLSAKSSKALETATANLIDYLQQYPSLNLPDVAHTLQIGRRSFEHRRMIVCQNLDDAVKMLSQLDPQRVFTHYQKLCNRSVVFMFSGQGAQYVNMGRELYQSEPIFKQQVDECSYLLRPQIGLDLRTVLYPSEEQVKEATQQLLQTAIAQPALFVIEYSLAKLWMAWGVHPEAMIGHSIGEYVAATLAGVFSLKDALALVAKRGKLMQPLPPGAMLSVQLPQQEVQPLLLRELSLAASNAPSYCVVSGSTDTVEQLQQQLQEKGVGCRRLHTTHAFHSQMMEPIIEPFTQLLQKLKLNPPQIPFVSNVSGTWITATQATDPNYWAKHLRQPVRFNEGITELIKTHERILLEVGPGRTLSTFALQHQKEELAVLTSIRHPQEQQSDVAFLLNTLGRLWLFGVQVDWSGFYTYERRHRLSLPTYPFERQRYWIEPYRQKWDDRPTPVSLGKKPDIADWFYIPFWKPSLPPIPLKQGELASQKTCTLVFIDECGLSSKLLKQLVEQQNQDVIAVKVGAEFTKLSECQYILNPQQPNDYDALIKELQTQQKLPKAIVHLWSVTRVDNGELELERVEKAQALGFYSLLFLAQALARQNITDDLKITVISNNLQPVTESEVLCPEKATLLGPIKTISQEYSNIRCRSIDVILPSPGNWQEEKLVEQLLTELTVPISDQVIAYRGLKRWVQTFEPVRFDEARVRTPRLRERGVYLITGGLGGIGLVVAEYLARTVQAKLLLIGRSTLPNRNEWEQWLVTNDDTDSTSRKIRKVQELQKLGAEVLVISADVRNREQMQKALAKATERFGAIHGVIHIALNAEDGYHTIQETSQTEAQLQFLPKVHELFVLEKVLQGKELDFCLLKSSLASVLGGIGFVSYSATNIFMDAFVHKHNQTNSCLWISVNWDNWEIREREQDAATEATLPKFFMTPTEGVEAFELVLSMGEFPQVVVSTGNLQARIDEWVKLEPVRDTDSSNQGDLFLNHQRPNLQTAYVAPRNEVEQTVTNIWQELLSVEQIGIYDNFFELGGHSLLATQVISRLRKAFQIDFSVRSLFNEPTIADISGYIERIRKTTKKLLTFTSTTTCDREELEL